MTLGLNVFAIVGESNSGKSTMIGQLTSQFGSAKNGLRGGRGDGFFNIAIRKDGLLSIWTRRMALQEARLSPEEAVTYISRVFENPKRPADCKSILVALRDQQHRGLADGDEYLRRFLAQGWKINSLVLMHSVTQVERYNDLVVPTLTLASDGDAPDRDLSFHSISDRVGQIRNHFGWT